MFDIKRIYDEIRENPILGSLNYSTTIEYISLSKLYEIEDSINFFDYPSDEEFIELTMSLETFGVIEPLLVMRDEAGGYMVLNGRSRLLALKKLYKKSNGSEKFSNIPCIVLDNSTNYSMIQGIIIAANMSYRKLSRENFMKAIFLLDEIYKTCDIFKSGTSVTRKIAKATGISRTTVNNYLELKNLSPLAIDLVVNKYMNLSVARVISKKDKDTQNIIITGLKNNINDIEKVYEMMKGPMDKIYVNDLKTSIPETWEMKIDRTNEMIPQYTYITLKVACQDVEKVFTNINDMRREYALKYLPLKENGLNKYFKVNFNENDIDQYIKRGFLTQNTYDKLTTGVFNEIIKRA